MRERAGYEEAEQEKEDEFHTSILPVRAECSSPSYEFQGIATINGMMRIATMFVILIIGLIAGPAVSL
jgi:hypothetical protein